MSCIDCGAKISRQAKRCRPCSAIQLNSDPAFRAARASGVRRKFADPDHRAKMAKVAARNGAKYWLEPANRKRAVERGKWLYANRLSRPETRERNVAAIRANSYKMTEHWLGWCPPEFRDEYRRLVRSKRLPASVAREQIEARVADIEAVRRPDFGDALSLLNRIAPVSSLPDGTYRYGNAVLTAGEVIRRAEARGWNGALAA